MEREERRVVSCEYFDEILNGLIQIMFSVKLSKIIENEFNDSV